jgi:hypothetical protein
MRTSDSALFVSRPTGQRRAVIRPRTVDRDSGAALGRVTPPVDAL